MTPAALIAPAADRNKGPILAVLRRVLPPTGLVLEIASGTGQHVVHFAAALPRLGWRPSDPDPTARASIAAWVTETGLPNVHSPIEIDVCEGEWPVERADAVICINMIHIAPWAATLGLMRGAARVLGDRGVLFLYGPYRRFGRHTAASNEAFDQRLRRSNPEWGIRDLEAVKATGGDHGFELQETVEMPANNLSVIFHRTMKN